MAMPRMQSHKMKPTRTPSAQKMMVPKKRMANKSPKKIKSAAAVSQSSRQFLANEAEAVPQHVHALTGTRRNLAQPTTRNPVPHVEREDVHQALEEEEEELVAASEADPEEALHTQPECQSTSRET
jgi:hypothetical protein